MRKILVTGGAGFIGSHVAAAYLEQGDRVWIVDDLSRGELSNVPEGAEFVRMDICDPGLDELFATAGGFDVVNHHAAQVDVRKSVADPRFDARVNIDGLLNVLETARRHGSGRVVFVSSGGVVYGEADHRPTAETAAKAPESPYGVSKLAAELYLQYYLEVHGMEYAALRYANVYGPRQDPHGEAGVVAIFSERIASGSPLTIYGDGLQTRDYVFVGDVAAANMVVSSATLDGGAIDERAFNVGTGVETTVVELAETLMSIAGTRVEVQHADARAGELLHSSLDTRRLQALGWKARVGLRDGLRQTYAHIVGTGASN